MFQFFQNCPEISGKVGKFLQNVSNKFSEIWFSTKNFGEFHLLNATKFIGNFLTYILGIFRSRFYFVANIQLRQLSSRNNIRARPVVALQICNHVHCLCLCIRSHIGKFQHHVITSNHFTACYVSTDTTCASRILWKWTKKRRRSNIASSDFSWNLGTSVAKLLGNYTLCRETQLWNHCKFTCGHIHFGREENWLPGFPTHMLYHY